MSSRVVFVDFSLKVTLEKLESGTFEDRRLAKWIRKAIQELHRAPDFGIRIPRKYWPAFYVQSYEIDNLWKVDLPRGWRLVYTLRTTELEILSVLLEWFDHSSYEHRFGY
ncbi:MAG: hypothetical protein AABY11_02145 [archaeon]